MIPALAPWAAELADLSPEAAALLGPLLPQLTRLLAPAFGADARAQGDPDGLDGLSRRGPPERLLLSEWGLALEAPDEFLRRAATQELLYSAPAFRGEEPPPRTMVVLFDAGPDSLGAPRLAQLALVMAAGRRARERKAKLAFGCISRPTEALIESAGPERFHRLLAMRTLERPAPNAAELWSAKLDKVQGLWVVGARGPAGPRGWCTLRIAEEPGDALHLTLSRDGRPLGRLRLGGLDGAAAARLLIDPFAPAFTPKPAPAGAGWRYDVLRFVARGDYLLGQPRPGRFQAWHLRPPAPFRRASTRRLSVEAEEQVLAVGWAWRQIHALTISGDTLTHWRPHRPPSRLSLKDLPVRPTPAPIPGPLYGGPSSTAIPPQDDGSRALYFTDSRRHLWRLRLQAHGARLERYRSAVSALAESSERGPGFLVHEDLLTVYDAGCEAFDPVVPGADLGDLPRATPGWVGGGRGKYYNRTVAACSALSFSSGRIRFRWYGQKEAVELQNERRLIPVGILAIEPEAMALLDPERPALFALRTNGQLEELIAFARPPLAIALSPGSPAIAWIDNGDNLNLLEQPNAPIHTRSLAELA